MDAYKELTTNWLAKLEGDKLEQVYEELLEKFPGYLGAHVAYLHGLDAPSDPAKLPHATEEPDVTTAWCEQLIATSEKVIKAIDQEKLLAYLGMKNDTRSDANKIKQEQEKQKGYLIEALCRRGTALCRLHALASAPAAREKLAAALAGNLNDLLKFTDLTDAKAIHYGVWHCFTLKHWGRAIKLLAKIQEDRPSKEAEERLLQAYDQLGWTHLERHARHALPARFPAAYRPF
ncbi:tripeptidyl-peptidase 2-like [Ostrinia furnacalis]|uniref:tripeptidyl-peptidase 2-like n=1 Tax=Ostrinia furnacalis TaxID=93504 RepID=UPI001039DA6A|nr:tripeptidyl-peptidase 2-like [Ostrinia furnacalis]